MFFADLHIHPSGKNFHHVQNGDQETFKAPGATLWHKIKANKRALAKGIRGTQYNQADIPRLIAGGVKVVFVALYPFEQGFLNHVGKKEPIPLLLNIAMRIPLKRIRFIRKSPPFDYFKDFLSEYEFCIRKSGQKSDGKIQIDLNGNERIEAHEKKIEVEGTYWVLAHDPEKAADDKAPWGKRSFKGIEDVDDIIDSENEILLVFTVEGAHPLSMKDQATPLATEQEMMNRISFMKKMDPPIFFITFAHHFDNDLCAHAKSFFKVPLWNPHQRKSLNFLRPEGNQPLTPEDFQRGFNEKGMRAARKLLHLDLNAQGQLVDSTEEGRRILLDFKHMSASSRKNLYDEVYKPYNQGKALADRLPVIASHVGYTGIKGLQELIDNYSFEDAFNSNEKDDSVVETARAKFNPWNINICDEEVAIICESGGLIGINFDQRVLGIMGKYKLKHLLFNKPLPGAKNMDSLQLILNNILGMADGLKAMAGELEKPLHVYDPNGFSFWNCIAIGSDYDGGIDPIDDYPTVIKFKELAREMKERLIEMANRGETQEFGITAENAEQLVSLFSGQNALNFLKKHFK